MKIKSARFFTSTDGLEDCPTLNLPEFAFIGRSNVGKSSLLNMLCNQRGLALVSSTPGRTRLINYYIVNESWCLVDLPGYGYAKAPKSERHRFQDFVADYIEGRAELAQVYVLIDSRHEPQKIDIEFLKWLSSCGTPYSIVFTKADKLSATKQLENQETFLAAVREITATEPTYFTTSAKAKTGRLELLRHLSGVMNGEV